MYSLRFDVETISKATTTTGNLPPSRCGLM